MAEGLRRIEVDGVPYRWKFDNVLTVIPGDRSGPQLYVDWGRRDSVEKEGPGNPPQIVTPRFVAEAVRFAVPQGWPAAGGSPLRLGFQAGNFTLAAKSGEPKDAHDRGEHSA